ncbi:type IX secretion system membrane protein PorP/SprF [Nibribacter koreensis]|uniref:Type IX secretion system membrane protein PorP/SprF n=1 Tax=Nibribacter koreensis TaxID=1084519 RepID=A0ABP8FQQ4_9BACT
MKTGRGIGLALLLWSLTVGTGSAQKTDYYSQYMVNNLLINPAVAGIENYIDVKSSIRKQWVGIDNSPFSVYLSANASIGHNDRNVGRNRMSRDAAYSNNRVERNNKFYGVRPHHGVGVVLQADRMGLLQSQALNLVYSYHIPLTKAINFSVGASGGFARQSFNSARAEVNDLMDPSLNGANMATLKADVSLGAWLYTRRGYLGFTGAHLLKSRDDFKSPFLSSLAISVEPVYVVTAGYRVQLQRYVAVVPSVLVRKMIDGPWMTDVNARVEYDNRVWAGASYRDRSAVSVMAGVNVNHLFSVGYAYDWTTSSLSDVNAGSHEVMLGMRLKNSSKALCPQWVW